MLMLKSKGEVEFPGSNPEFGQSLLPGQAVVPSPGFEMKGPLSEPLNLLIPAQAVVPILLTFVSIRFTFKEILTPASIIF
jgi:hypothetical protein